MNSAEEQRIAGLCREDPEYFADLYESYIDKIYRFIFYRVHHKETAEDLTSQTFMKALQGIKSFKGGSFSSWLYRIARNTLIDHYRTGKKDIGIEQVPEMAGEEDPPRIAGARIGLERVRKYIDNLPGDQRDIVMMRVWDELSYKEIAEVMGKKEGACKVAFSRAIGRIRKEMPLPLLLLISFYDVISR